VKGRNEKEEARQIELPYITILKLKETHRLLLVLTQISRGHEEYNNTKSGANKQTN